MKLFLSLLLAAISAVAAHDEESCHFHIFGDKGTFDFSGLQGTGGYIINDSDKGADDPWKYAVNFCDKVDKKLIPECQNNPNFEAGSPAWQVSTNIPPPTGCVVACTKDEECPGTHTCTTDCKTGPDGGKTCTCQLSNGCACTANPDCHSGSCAGGVCTADQLARVSQAVCAWLAWMR